MRASTQQYMVFGRKEMVEFSGKTRTHDQIAKSMKEKLRERIQIKRPVVTKTEDNAGLIVRNRFSIQTVAKSVTVHKWEAP